MIDDATFFLRVDFSIFSGNSFSVFIGELKFNLC